MGGGMSSYDHPGYGCKTKSAKGCEHIKVEAYKGNSTTDGDINNAHDDAPVAYIKLFGRTVGALRADCADEACECFTRELGADKFPGEEAEQVHFAKNLQIDGATVRAGCCKITGNNNVVYGHMNEITGHGNTVTGNMNKVAGNRSKVRGNMNNIEGDNPTVSGNMNSIRGNHADVRGSMNSTNGHGNVTNGRLTSSTTTGFFCSQPPVSFELDPRASVPEKNAASVNSDTETSTRVPDYSSYYSGEKSNATRGASSTGVHETTERDSSDTTPDFVVVMPGPPADTTSAPPPYVYPTFDDRA